MPREMLNAGVFTSSFIFLAWLCGEIEMSTNMYVERNANDYLFVHTCFLAQCRTASR